MTRILAIADEVADSLYGPALQSLQPDVVLSCGDLPFEYLEYMVTVLSVPLLYVPGNHDPDLKRHPYEHHADHRHDILIGSGPGPDRALANAYGSPPGPEGCVNVDGRIVEAAGLVIAGLGGSVNYAPGPNRYSQKEMRRRAWWLQARTLLRRPIGPREVHVLITHSPPKGVGDEPDDPAHVGFAAFHPLVERLRPRLLLHGHVHPYGSPRPDRVLNGTRVVNVVPYKLLELEVVQGGNSPAKRSGAD